MVRTKKKKKLQRTKVPGSGLPRLTGETRTATSGAYQPWMDAEAQELVGKLGARNVDLATYFEVSVKTIEYWIKTKPLFQRAVRRGRIEAGLLVSQALFKKATGFTLYTEVVVKNVVKEYHKNGKLKRQYTEPIAVRVPKEIAPDAYAAHKYLSIMFRETWADITKVNVDHNHSGEINVRQVEELSMENLSDEVKNFLFDLNLQQLSNAQNN